MNTAIALDNETIQSELRESGFCYLPGADRDLMDELLPTFGTVIQTTDVTASPESARLVTSDRALDLHTDHYRADFIAWFCVEQSDEGGETVLVDAEAAFANLSVEHQACLERVMLTEHKVFSDDKGSYPLVGRLDGRRKFYYSFWLLTKLDRESDREALAAFRSAVEQAPQHRFKLQPNDILVIDNGRMLHGRTAIDGNKQRHLVRYWIRAHASEGPEQTKTSSAFVLPDPITSQRIDFLRSKGIDPAVAALDLSMIKMKLQDPEEGKGWTPDECEEAEVEYKRFLTLNRLFPRSIVPTTVMDTMWHYHILDTRAYHRDSDTIFGEYFHHFPYFGMRGEQDAQNLSDSFQTTQRLYEETFGEPIIREGPSSCWHSCQSRCWHACSNKDVA